MPNSLYRILPYWLGDTWVFDDEFAGLFAEPFVSGIPEMITDMVKDIPNAKEGFWMTFSARKFPGFQKELVWVREEDGGNWYRISKTQHEGWLCPALSHYFDKAPKRLYAKAEPIW